MSSIKVKPAFIATSIQGQRAFFNMQIFIIFTIIYDVIDPSRTKKAYTNNECTNNKIMNNIAYTHRNTNEA